VSSSGKDRVWVEVLSDVPEYGVLAHVYVRKGQLGRRLEAFTDVVGCCWRIWKGRCLPETEFEKVIATAGRLKVCLFYYPCARPKLVTLPHFVVGECDVEELHKAIRISAALGLDVGREYLVEVLRTEKRG